MLPFLFLLILAWHQDQSFTQDLGRHIKMGEVILSCHCVPKTNLFSYTQPDHPFINHHWLSEVIFYELYTYMGAYSLLILKVLLLCISFGIVYVLAFKKSPFWAIIWSVPYLYILSERFDTRPELFSFLFISLFVFLIQKYRETHKRTFLLFLPFIELLWVNIHIYFILGIVLFGCLISERIVKAVFKQGEFRMQNAKFKITTQNSKLYFIALSLIAACFINPSGIQGAVQPLTILQNYGYTIVENQNIFFLNAFFFNPHTFVFEIVAVLILIGVFLVRQKVFLYPLLLMLFALFEASAMIRNFPIFVLITFFYWVYITKTLENQYFQKSGIRILLSIGIGVMAAIITWQQVKSFSFGLSYTKGADNAVAFYHEHQLRGKIFNNFDIGSFLIFKLYPGEKVFVDGRPEAYSPSFFDQYKKMQEDPVLFDRIARNDQINTVFFAHTDITPWAQTFLSTILKNPTWVPVYSDERIIILIRNIPENKELIARFRKTF